MLSHSSANNLQVILSFEDLTKPDYYIFCRIKTYTITEIRGAAYAVRDGILWLMVISKFPFKL